MPKVLITDPVPPTIVQSMRVLFPSGVEIDVVPTSEDADFAVHAADADVLLVIFRKIDSATIALSPHVRFVQRLGAGYDNIDVAALARTGVRVGYTPGANAAGVAEHTIMLMLALLKRLPQAEQATRAGRLAPYELIQAGIGDLVGATIGLVGIGSIGQAVAIRLAAFGSEVLYTSRHRLDSIAEQRLGVTYKPLPELLAAASIVSLHVPLTNETKGLIGEAELAGMRPGALLINTARGGIVDEAALLQALESSHLGGAGLDVLEHEQDNYNAFANRLNVIVTPHVAGTSQASGQRIMQQAIANVVQFLGGETPTYLVRST